MLSAGASLKSFASVRSWLKMPGDTLPSASCMSPKLNVPSVDQIAIRPISMPKSPTRLTMNALFAAVLALCRSM